MSAPVASTHFRLFLALAVPDEVKDAIETAQTELRRVIPAKAARWMAREQFHLTLKFLGNVPVSQVDELAGACRLACEKHAPLRLTARKIGFFPNVRLARVVWVGITDLESRLNAVWQSLQSAAQPFTKEPPETHFTGHVTLARLNRLQRVEFEALAKSAAGFEHTLFGEWTADGLELKRSELSSEGARHSVLAQLPLAGRETFARRQFP